MISFRSSVVLLLVASSTMLASCGRTRKAATDAEMAQVREARVAEARADGKRSLIGLMQRTAISAATDRTLDILVLSGGGDYGAFGAGVLAGWSELKGDDALPEFDVVTGVSAGALIAPFAFLGQKEDLATVEMLFRNPKPDWIKPRGLLGFLPDNESLAELPGLERELRSAVNDDRIHRIAAEGQKGRRFFVNTTDLDLGGARPFELTEAAEVAVKSGSSDRLHNILLASAGIPGAFPSREIDGVLYVDGGVSSNILFGAWGAREESFAFQFRSRFPNLPKPRVRYWVILNNQAQTIPATVQPSWISVVGRSVEVAIRSSTVTSLRHLFTFTELVTLRGDAEIEVKWLSIPDDWRPPVEGVFKKETMNNLADIGRKLGADPSSWKTKAP
jgi:hypothetical protein